MPIDKSLPPVAWHMLAQSYAHTQTDTHVSTHTLLPTVGTITSNKLTEKILIMIIIMMPQHVETSTHKSVCSVNHITNVIQQ